MRAWSVCVVRGQKNSLLYTCTHRSNIRRGTKFTKTWSVFNPGPLTWPEGVHLCFLRGHREMCVCDTYKVRL